MARHATPPSALRAGRPSRNVVAIVATCAVLVLGVAGSGSGNQTRNARSLPAEVAGSRPSADQLVGTWREEQADAVVLVRFASDGTFAIDTGTLDVPYFAAGTYELEGDTIVFVSNGPACASSWKWKAGIVSGGPESDELDVVFLNAWCTQFRGEEHTFERS